MKAPYVTASTNRRSSAIYGGTARPAGNAFTQRIRNKRVEVTHTGH
jgi:hypothetical protein